MKCIKIWTVSFVMAATAVSSCVFAVNPLISIVTEAFKKIEIAISELPQSIRDDIERTYPDGKMTKAWKETDDNTGKTTGYEVELYHDGKARTLTFDVEGKQTFY
jgi:hypothetical protein